ncbi:antitoxin [Marinomonas primoryensis]|uniref:Antitoxin n=1 Tax=Marinomonas primoryensis TaxID=178399 RepID=A0A2Z4PPL5_9GAMM|nr:type II toxin-antitoxin system HicB family antitoxin [Marinomonas primoryensis]AWX99527.1 antitoxin [Marinomonas primoryensis]
MKYPVTLLAENEGGFSASFEDIPEAFACGETHEEALEDALDALVTAFEFYFEDEKAVPLPSKVTNDDYVTVPATSWAKVLVLNSMVEQNVKRSELARRINVKKQNIKYMLDLRHETKLSTIERAAKALGKNMEVSFA